MRVLATTACTLLLALAGCSSYRVDSELDDLVWGEAFPGDFDVVVERARARLKRDFPLGLHPDHADDAAAGDLWTVWRYQRDPTYRNTRRVRARVKVEDLGEGQVRVGVSVVSQINDNIDNPDVIEEARWVNTSRMVDAEVLIENSIAQRYNSFTPSEVWKEKHAAKKRTTPRPDLTGEDMRQDDVALEEEDFYKDAKKK